MSILDSSHSYHSKKFFFFEETESLYMMQCTIQIKIKIPVHGGFELVKVSLVCQSQSQGEARSLQPSRMPKLPKTFYNLIKTA